MMALSVPGSRISCRNTSFSDIVKIMFVSSKTQNMQASYHIRHTVCKSVPIYTFSSFNCTGGGFDEVTAAQNSFPNAKASFTLLPGSFTKIESVSPE